MSCAPLLSFHVFYEDKTMANSAFARNQLLKHGWKDGSGLGKEESGIKEAIKVKLKHDTTGVGHDPGKEFTCHWWDHVFNKAASSITVETTKEGVQFKKSSAEEKQSAKTFANKSVLYSGFVKAAVLQATETDLMTEVSCHDDSDGEDQSDADENKSISKLTEEELFSQCEGRTAHKGARHGLKQNAKLLRIQQQEAILLESMKKRTNQIDANKTTNENARKKSLQEVQPEELCDMQQEHGLAETLDDSLGCRKRKTKKKKKSKDKEKDVDFSQELVNSSQIHHEENELQENSKMCSVEETLSKKSSCRKSKKSKKKKRKAEAESENTDMYLPEKKKKSKKKSV